MRSSSGVVRLPVLWMWTMCEGAPVMAVALITSCTEAYKLFGTSKPLKRMCTWQEAR